MQLIRIESIPIKYEMKIQNARLEIKNAAAPPEFTQRQEPARLNLHTQNIQVQLNSYEMRKQFDMKNNMDLARDGAQKGYENIQRLTAEYVETGKQLAQIEKGITISDIIQQKALEQPSSYTVFLPNGGTEISWIPNRIDKQYVPGELDFNWNTKQRELNFIRGSFGIHILQYPEVNIEYLGGPNYVPPSADPNYQESLQ